jgi:hypothetical protein
MVKKEARLTHRLLLTEYKIIRKVKKWYSHQKHACGTNTKERIVPFEMMCPQLSDPFDKGKTYSFPRPPYE